MAKCLATSERLHEDANLAFGSVTRREFSTSFKGFPGAFKNPYTRTAANCALQTYGAEAHMRLFTALPKQALEPRDGDGKDHVRAAERAG